MFQITEKSGKYHIPFGNKELSEKVFLEWKDYQIFYDVGDKVVFDDCYGETKFGKIIKLNPKRALIDAIDGTKWNAHYYHLKHNCLSLRKDRLKRADRLNQVIIETLKVMKKYHLKNWKLGFAAGYSKLGFCNFRRQLIKINLRHLIEDDPSDVTDTILHEIAHAIAGQNAGHGPQWKLVAESLGATPKACVSINNKEQDRILTIKQQICIGDTVSFDHLGEELSGRVERTNKNTVTVNTGISSWRIPYLLLKQYQFRH